jgi:hypothetical protein
MKEMRWQSSISATKLAEIGRISFVFDSAAAGSGAGR